MDASRADFQEVTQKVKNKKKHIDKPRANQGSPSDIAEPNKIAASTHYDFKGKNLTPYGGLFPVATMLEKLGLQKLVDETLTIKRIPRAMTIYQFVLGMVLAIYVGFARLNHIRFVAQDPMLTGILKVSGLPGQSTFWRFLASLNLNVAGQLLQLQRILRERVWAAAHVGLKSITLDTDTTVHTLYGRQMGARKGYNPKNKGKKSYQPILTFMAETHEYVWGELRNGDRPDGKPTFQTRTSRNDGGQSSADSLTQGRVLCISQVPINCRRMTWPMVKPSQDTLSKRMGCFDLQARYGQHVSRQRWSSLRFMSSQRKP